MRAFWPTTSRARPPWSPRRRALATARRQMRRPPRLRPALRGRRTGRNRGRSTPGRAARAPLASSPLSCLRRRPTPATQGTRPRLARP
eukprot:3976700-Alexandrium_andersonii.AAC.1